MKRRVLSTGLLLSCLLAPSALHAQGNVDKAKEYFNAGATAYAQGQFTPAIQAFEQANKILPKPQIIFSIAQAHRKQYFLDKDVQHLRAAIKRYHEYIDQVPEGGRRSDAAQALSELEPIASRIGDSGEARAAAKDPTRLMIMTMPEDATVELDGKPAKARLAMEVTPGKHHVKVSAPGYFDDERDTEAPETALRPVDVPLREKPAHLLVTCASGATISIDGRAAGTTPLAAKIDVPAGSHFVTITKNGHRAYSQDIEVARDEDRRIDVNLESTGQRITSYGFFAFAGASLIAGGVFTGLALQGQSDAQSVLDRRGTQNITIGDVDEYERARGRRDDWTKVSIAAYGISGATLATGLVLYLFDQPTPSSSARSPEEKKRAPSPPSPGKDPIEMSMIPLASPSMVGGSLVGRF